MRFLFTSSLPEDTCVSFYQMCSDRDRAQQTETDRQTDCTYTLLFHAHLSVAQFVCVHPRTSPRACTYTHGSSVCKKKFAHVSHLSISPSPVSCFTSLCCSCTPTLTSPFCPYVLAVLTCPESAGHAHLRKKTRSLAIWPSPPSTQVMTQRVRQDHLCGQ